MLEAHSLSSFRTESFSTECPTSKMSHDGGWREACESTTRDRPWRWLWRLVGRWTRWPVASARKGQGGVDSALHSSGCSNLGNPKLTATLSLRKNPRCLRGVRRRDRRRSPPIHVMSAQELMSFAIPLVRTQGASETMPLATHANFRDEPSNARSALALKLPNRISLD